MSVSTISGSSSLSTQAMTALMNQRTRSAKADGGALATAAKALGLSTDDLTTQLRSGKSMADIAQAQGVSRDDLAAALKAGMPADLASSSQADDVVNSIIDQVGMPQRPDGPGGSGGPGGPGGPGAPQGPPPSSWSSSQSGASTGILTGSLTQDQQNTLDSLSSLLGTDSSTLMSDLQNGTSLSDLISNSGISAGTLASVIQDGLLVDTTA